MSGKTEVGELDWAKGGGLIPAIIQDHRSRQVLMLGMMSQESLAVTESTGSVTFWSRTRQVLWTKGETSGHRLKVRSILRDCDRDSLLIEVEAVGPTCHQGTVSCFDGGPDGPRATSSASAILDHLWETIEDRAAHVLKGLSGGEMASYTARLLAEGVGRCAQKVGEEGVEVALAAVSGEPSHLVSEAADLLYHLLVLLKAKDLNPAQVWAELERRHHQGSQTSPNLA